MSRRLYLIFHGRYPSEKAAALFAKESAEAFEEEGYAVTLLAPRRFGRGKGEAVYLPTLDLFNVLPGRLAFLASFFVFSVSTYIYLIFRARPSDIIYSNESLPLWLASFSFPNTFYEMHDYPGGSPALYHGLFRRVRGVIATNKLKADRLVAEYRSAKDKVLTEKNAVALEQFSLSQSKREAREALGLSLSEKIIVYTGHLYSWKGVDTLAKTYSRIAPNTFIYFVGGTEEDVARMEKQYPSAKNLIFKHHRPHDEIPLWQRAADVLVLPNSGKENISTQDTSPMKLFEYMASGTPIVASRLPSIEEIVTDKEVFFVEPDNAEALADGITNALTSPEATVRATAARAAVGEHTWEKRAKRILVWLTALPSAHESYRHERILYFASLAVTTLFLLIFLASGNAAGPISGVESDGYLPLAVSIYEAGLFPLTTHTPGYPFFLALTAVPFGTVLLTLILQAFFLAWSGVLLYRLFEGIFSSGIRFWGALAFAIEPFTAFTAVQPLSEALFLLLFIGGLSLLRQAYLTDRSVLVFAAGISLGASALVRPIVLYMLPVILIALGIFLASRKKKIAAALLTCIGGLLLVLLPWAYRNHETFGVWTLSTKAPFTLYFYEASELLQHRMQIPQQTANEVLIERAQKVFPEVRAQDDMVSPKYAPFLTKEALSIIGESPALFAKLHLVALGTFFLSDGYRLLWYELTDGAIALPNITSLIASGNGTALQAYFTEHPFQAIVFVLGFAFWLAVFLFALVGAGKGVRVGGDVRLAIIFLVCVIAYFALMTGLESQARYRIPVTPFLFMLASYGLFTVALRTNAHR